MNIYTKCYLTKYSDYSDTLNQAKSIDDSKKLLMIAGVAGSWVASSIAGHYLNSRLQKTPKVNKENINNILSSQGLPNNFPTFEVKNFDNAAYIDPIHKNDVKDFLYVVGANRKTTSKDTKNLLESHGAIIYDPSFASAGIVSHEGGHAKIQQDGGLGAFNQSYLRPIGNTFGSFSPLISALTYKATQSPKLALIAGSVSALGYLPTLINEYQATSHANDYLNSPDFSGTDKYNHKKYHKNNLLTAYGTYLIPPLIASAAMLAQYKLNQDQRKVIDNYFTDTNF